MSYGQSCSRRFRRSSEPVLYPNWPTHFSGPRLEVGDGAGLASGPHITNSGAYVQPLQHMIPQSQSLITSLINSNPSPDWGLYQYSELYGLPSHSAQYSSNVYAQQIDQQQNFGSGYTLPHHGQSYQCELPTSAISTPPAAQSPTLTQATDSSDSSVKQFKCDYSNCDKSYAHYKDLKRHQTTKHCGDQYSYHCRCGKSCPRKDNHRRHLGKCKANTQHGVYRCRCHHYSEDKADYDSHVRQCKLGFGKIGRPKMF
ncbi:hypothetical protein RRF57_011906 [Xylaria bambusicola]|uniref:C2H2-type domain-containing protein n=1 Tax=Xylaria bambusicola TaxID=326684 RepID=A0AAN7V3A4_9PEZI